MTALPKRIRLLPHAPETDIITTDGTNLGKMLPGLGYWVTEQNSPIVSGLLARGFAVDQDPKDAPDVPGLRIGAQDGDVSGMIEVGADRENKVDTVILLPDSSEPSTSSR